MKTVYKILRSLLIVLLVLPLAVPALLYIILSIPGVQDSLGRRAERELTTLLGSEVTIGGVDFQPFSRIVLSNVSVADTTGRPALDIGHLGAGISISESIWNRRLVVSYAEFIDMSLHLWRDSVGSQLNIDPIISRFKKKESGNESSFDLSVNMVVIRRSAVTYDVLSAPAKGDGEFDPSHISVSGLRADLRAPRISNDDICVYIRRMGVSDRSGLTLSSLSATLELTKHHLALNDLSVQMPHSHIAFDDIELPVSPLSPGFSPDSITTSVVTLPGSYVSTSDLSPLVPALSSLDLTADLEIEARGGLKHLSLPRLGVNVRDKDTWLNLSGYIANLDHAPDSLVIDLDRISANFNGPATVAAIAAASHDGRKIASSLSPLASLGDISVLGQLGAANSHIDFNGSIVTSCGSIDIDAGIMRSAGAYGPLKIDGKISSKDFNPSGISPAVSGLTDVSLEAIADLTIGHGGNINGTSSISVSEVTWNGTRYTDIIADGRFQGHNVDVSIDSHAPLADFSLRGIYEFKGRNPLTELYADIRYLALAPFAAKGPYADYHLSAGADISLRGRNVDDLNGWIKIENLHFADAIDDKSIDLGMINIESQTDDSIRTLTIDSSPVNMSLTGAFSYPALLRDMKTLVARAYPSLLPSGESPAQMTSTADLHLTVNPDSALAGFFKLPVEVIYPLEIQASADAAGNKASLLLNAPYLKQKDKLIEGTSLTAGIDGNDSTSYLGFSTIVPTKNGPMDLSVNASGEADSVITNINWHVDRAKDFHGDLRFISSFSRDDDNMLNTLIRFRPTDLVFNDSAWHVTPARIGIRPGRIDVSDFGATRHGQTIAINGVASPDSLSRLIVSLDHIDLDYVFETLAISDAVNFGGRATGKLYGEALLSKDPILYTPRLMVDGLSYNHCTFGDGDIRSRWDNNTKTITIEADITQPGDTHSTILGYIKPLTEELDFKFSAQEAPAGFMLPFMSAFTSSVDGRISGDAHLFGTFKDLDLAGDIYVRDLKMKLDFTNTTYTVSDSVHIVPGKISFDNVSLHDRDGNSARLSGNVTHQYFHEPEFRFDITDATDMLVYDIGEHDTSDPWYGRIYGNGSATVVGVPGKIDIGVKMRTAPKSTFTFVLSDAEQSVEYDFIILRDRDREKKDSIASLDPTPLIVRQLRERINRQEQGPPTAYAMEFIVDITPEATLNLIMDPVGGDKITAHGSGHLRMNYSSDGELEMYGDYSLDRGSYNFTLQDIIIKDFTILEGSKITFFGDPYAAQLNIRAAYTLNANLSDLDESFLEDRELTRTNVKVNAIMIVTGDMRQPDIKFDLEFPTLTTDTYRKVRSIISTDEMMSRQIIYLLALNRFYTPEYMATTHGNELVSVASSTLSSRLGSMLGQLSDTWSIAPAIRSDRGDFSDVEVDVALSSQLLDNRLLFNGNLGYRDKSLNNNSFIGDFDIRYLLNRAGTIQLKAYNRYNDQNYYLKNALTTQGIGVVFKRDFDNIFSFLRPIRNKLSKEDAESDSAKTDVPAPSHPVDSVRNDSIRPATIRFEVEF
ncbi:MAG: translocation/assembly module TamB [Duncaniella sp.]|nr:translocation/assembly module TamB [Duncaniella sp.]